MIAQKYRLRRWRAQKILKKEESEKIGMFTVKFAPNNCNFHRWSITLSRKFAKLATVRNKKRRQIYESIRNYVKEHEEKPEIKHFDVILIPHKQILSCNYHKIYQNITNILKFLEKSS